MCISVQHFLITISLNSVYVFNMKIEMDILKWGFKVWLCGYIYLQEQIIVHMHLNDYICKLVIGNQLFPL